MFICKSFDFRTPSVGEIVYDIISPFDGGEFVKVKILEVNGDHLLVEEFETSQETLASMGVQRIRKMVKWFDKEEM